jgi:hypothetical protein
MTTHIDKLRKATAALLEKSTVQERFEKRKDVLIEILTTLNFLDDEKQSVERLLDIIKDYTGASAVGIRLKHGDDCPYYVTRGFSDEFIELESSLKCRDKVFSDNESDLECMCGYVLQGTEKNKYSYFTDFGSFYTPDVTGLVNGLYGPLPVGITIRGVCVKSGYGTVVTIPLRCKSNCTIGLLQLNDEKKDAISLETVNFFEGISITIGTALSRIRLLECLRERCVCVDDRSGEDNKLQSN